MASRNAGPIKRGGSGRVGVCGVGWGDCVCVPCVAYGFIFRVCGVWRARNPFVINNAPCDRTALKPYGFTVSPPRCLPAPPPCSPTPPAPAVWRVGWPSLSFDVSVCVCPAVRDISHHSSLHTATGARTRDRPTCRAHPDARADSAPRGVVGVRGRPDFSRFDF